MNSPRPRLILTCSVAALISAAARPRVAADDLWNVASGNWNTPTNWSDGTVPSGENADVNTGVATISANLAATPNDIVVGDTTTGRLDQTAGSASTGSNNWMYVGRSGGTGTFNLANTAATGGTLTGYGTGAGSMSVGQRFYDGGYQPDGGGAGTGTVNVNTTGSLTVNGDTYIGGSGGGTGTLNLDAGTFNRTSGWCFVGGDYNGTAGGQGTINVSGGTMMQSGDTYFGRGAGSVGTLNMTGGTLTGGNLHFGYDAGGGKGVANLSGTSVINLSGSLLVADGSTNVGTVTIGGSASVTTGGTLTIGNGNGTGSGASAATVVMNAGTLTTNGEIQVGNNGGTGSFTQNGGAVVANNWVTTGREYNDNNVGSTGVFTLNGGTFTRTAGSTGFFNITNGAGDVGTVNLNGGVLTVDKIVANGGTAATSTLNFNGGTLRASSSGTTDPGSGTNVAGDVTFLQGVTQVNVRNGGAVVDPNGFSITFNQVLSHSNVAGDNATDGGLTLNDSSSGGSGVLTLTAANTYTGPTKVNNSATLVLSTGSIASRTLTITAGATLTLGNNTALPNTLTMVLLSSANSVTATATTVNLNQPGADVIAALLFDGKAVAGGTYTAIQLNSQEGMLDPNGDIDFEGTGELTVVPEPSTWIGALVGVSGLLICEWRRRRSWARSGLFEGA